MRVLQISSDRSKRGILFPGTPAFQRQEAYAKQFGNLDIIGFSRKSDGAQEYRDEQLRVIPTNSRSRLSYGFDGIGIANRLPRPDVVTVQDPFETGLVAWWIARKFNVPLHVQVHTDFLSPEYARLSFWNRVRVWIARFVLRHATHIRVVSERTKCSIEERYKLLAPIIVMPIFVNVAKFKAADLADPSGLRSKYRLLLLVVARNAPEKNIALAIKAFEKSAPHDAGLIICSDTEEGDLESRRIHFVRLEPIQLYKNVDLVLVPSKYEGYGLVTVEALASGKPVLSTDVGIARESGAIVTTEEKFSDSLAEWFKKGPRTGALKSYPYESFDEYVRAYCEDTLACAKSQKSE